MLQHLHVNKGTCFLLPFFFYPFSFGVCVCDSLLWAKSPPLSVKKQFYNTLYIAADVVVVDVNGVVAIRLFPSPSTVMFLVLP